MIAEIKREGFDVNGYKFIDYTTLTLEEKKMVLDWRNSRNVRRWMYNQDIIPLEDHLNFIKQLADKEDKYYWLVISPQGEPLGSVYIVDVDRIEDISELGLYMRPDSKVFGFDFVRTCFYFYFEILDFNHVYCSVDVQNNDAMSIDMFLGCIFSEKKIEGGNEYLVSTNLTKDIFAERYKLKFRDYLTFCKSLK